MKDIWFNIMLHCLQLKSIACINKDCHHIYYDSYFWKSKVGLTGYVYEIIKAYNKSLSLNTNFIIRWIKKDEINSLYPLYYFPNQIYEKFNKKELIQNCQYNIEFIMEDNHILIVIENVYKSKNVHVQHHQLCVSKLKCMSILTNIFYHEPYINIYNYYDYLKLH